MLPTSLLSPELLGDHSGQQGLGAGPHGAVQ